MTPVTYIVETESRFYGPFATVQAACDYAVERDFTTFSVLQLDAP